MFWRRKDNMKGKCYVCSSYKQRYEVYLVYLNRNRTGMVYVFSSENAKNR